MATTISALAFAVPTAADKGAYVQRAEQLLTTFFLNPDTRMVPEVRFAQVDPGNVEAGGDKQFAIAVSALLGLADASSDTSSWFRKHSSSFLCRSRLAMECGHGCRHKPSGWSHQSKAEQLASLATTLLCGTMLSYISSSLPC